MNGDHHKLQKKGFRALPVCACLASLLPPDLPALGLNPAQFSSCAQLSFHRLIDLFLSSSLMISSRAVVSCQCHQCLLLLLRYELVRRSSSRYSMMYLVHSYTKKSISGTCQAHPLPIHAACTGKRPVRTLAAPRPRRLVPRLQPASIGQAPRHGDPTSIAHCGPSINPPAHQYSTPDMCPSVNGQ